MIDSLNSKLTGDSVRTKLSALAAGSTYQYAALAALTLFALTLRLYRLGEWSLWIDEAISLARAQNELANPWTPLSFRFVALAIRALGVSAWSARLAPALLGVLSLPLLFFPARRLFGPAVALLAVALLAVSPWHLFWSQNVRFYTLLMLFYTLALFVFFHWLERDRLGYLAAFLLLILLAALERMNALLVAPVIGAYLLALLLLPFGRPAAFRWRNLLLLAAPAVFFALYLIFGASVVADLIGNLFGRRHDPLRVLLSVIYDIGLPLFLMGLLGGLYLLLQKSRAGLYFFIAALVPVVVIVLISPFTQIFSRYAFISLPAWALLGAVAAKEILANTQKHARLLALGVVLLLFADAFSHDVLYFTHQNGDREDFKAAFAQVGAGMQPGDLLVTTRPELAAFYLGEDAIDSNRIDIDAIQAGGNRAWFVMDHRTHISVELAAWLEANARLVGVHDVYIPGRPMLMRVHLFDPAGSP